ncbi:MAG: hypothetical protein ABW146_08455 [Candidatus Sedimenticola sp. 6PFRAG7]
MSIQTALPGIGAPIPIKGSRNAYAAPPGTGPKGENCRSCRHAWYHETSKRYWKCGLVKATRGTGTDIRISSPACRLWEKK